MDPSFFSTPITLFPFIRIFPELFITSFLSPIPFKLFSFPGLNTLTRDGHQISGHRPEKATGQMISWACVIVGNEYGNIDQQKQDEEQNGVPGLVHRNSIVRKDEDGHKLGNISRFGISAAGFPPTRNARPFIERYGFKMKSSCGGVKRGRREAGKTKGEG